MRLARSLWLAGVLHGGRSRGSGGSVVHGTDAHAPGKLRWHAPVLPFGRVFDGFDQCMASRHSFLRGAAAMVPPMGDSYVANKRRSRGHSSLRAGFFVLLAAFSVQATAAEPLKLYLYKEKGHAVYATHKPHNVEYTEVYPGSGAARPVLSDPPPRLAADTTGVESGTALVGWAASCKGVNKTIMDQRAAQWQDAVTKYAKAHGVPAALVRAVIRVESCFDPRAESRVGARGLMQLMPRTAAQLGVTDSFDADQNIAGGVRYLSQLLNRFENDAELAIAAYNAGPTAVDAYGGIPPFTETRRYVERVLAEFRGKTPAAAKKSKH